MNNKVARVLEGAVLVALGVIIAIFGIGTAIDLYFGIVFTVGGVCLLLLAVIGLSKKDPSHLSDLVLGSVLLTIGICLFTPWLSLAPLINLLVIAIMGLGIGLILTGAYFLSKKMMIVGVGQIVVGALMVTFTVIYKLVPDFAQAFWIIIGVLVAVYGVLVIVASLVEKKK